MCVCARVCGGVRWSARASVFCRSIGKHLLACVCVCVAGLCVYASALCRRCGGTAATGGVNSSAGGAGRPRVHGCGSVRSALGVARVGRRCDVDEPHDQRAMGRPIFAHVGDRRRRRHLRHRRLRWHHLLQGRVGKHRRRCAAGLSQGGMVGGYTRWVLQGYCGGTLGYYMGVLRGYYRGYSRGTQAVLKPY
jgi:hypothetical protein